MMRLASVGAPARARGTRVARTRKRTRTDLVQATLRAEDRDVAVIPRAASARHRGRALDPARRARRLTGRMGGAKGRGGTREGFGSFKKDGPDRCKKTVARSALKHTPFPPREGAASLTLPTKYSPRQCDKDDASRPPPSHPMRRSSVPGPTIPPQKNRLRLRLARSTLSPLSREGTP